MKMLSRWIAFVIMLSLISCNSAFGQTHETLELATKWLIAQQDESGAFKSKHYGTMKQGAALTSLAMYAIAMTPEESRKENGAAIERAFQFLLPGTMNRGRVANPDGSLDHPVYGTAMFLVAAQRLELDLDDELARKLLKYLVDSQCVESRGFEPDNPNYGGWDVIGPDVMAGKTSGTNVSITSFVLEAFECWHATDAMEHDQAPDLDGSIEKAKGWLKRLKKTSNDGGFIFTAQPNSALNKAKTYDGKPQSYATATCDGFRIYGLLSEDHWHNEDPFDGSWIEKNVVASKVFGFADDDQSGWPDALRYYHLQTVARIAKPVDRSALLSNDWSERVSVNILAHLKKFQKEDGSFQNSSSLMRENDPLIATSFAIIALGAISK